MTKPVHFAPQDVQAVPARVHGVVPTSDEPQRLRDGAGLNGWVLGNRGDGCHKGGYSSGDARGKGGVSVSKKLVGM